MGIGDVDWRWGFGIETGKFYFKIINLKMEPKKDKFKSLRTNLMKNKCKIPQIKTPVTSIAATTVKGDQGNPTSL